MAERKLARRYAISLLGLSRERGVMDAAYADMDLVHRACRQSHDLSLFLRNPIIHADKKVTVIRSLFGDKVSELTLAFLELIARKRRERYLEDIATEFVAAYKDSKGISTAHIITAAALAPELRNEVTGFLKNKTRHEIELTETVDDGIIGGYILRWGDEQVDASISRMIRELRMTFKPNLYIKDF